MNRLGEGLERGVGFVGPGVGIDREPAAVLRRLDRLEIPVAPGTRRSWGRPSRSTGEAAGPERAEVGGVEVGHLFASR